jgi:hypothetical protein
MQSIKKFLFLVFLMTALLSELSAQQEVSYRIVLDDKQVPREVLAGFKAKYPDTYMSIWYTSHITYWYEDYAPSWYGTWYPVRQTVVHKFEKPAYYEVDFKLNNESSRAIFNRYGQWFETRTKINALPEEVASGLRESEFGEWKPSNHKERIEVAGSPDYVYRLQVTNRKLSYILRLNEAGEVVQIKYE